MTENVKKTLLIILNSYKDEKFTETEALTLLECVLNANNCGGSIITYPVYPTYTEPKKGWWDNQPMWTTTCTTGDIKDFKQSSTDDVNIKSNV